LDPLLSVILVGLDCAEEERFSATEEDVLMSRENDGVGRRGRSGAEAETAKGNEV